MHVKNNCILKFGLSSVHEKNTQEGNLFLLNSNAPAQKVQAVRE